LENRFIEARYPFTLWFLVFGLVVALLLTLFAGFTGITLGLLFLGAYMGMAAWCFGHYNFWIPIAVPLLIQLPLASLLSLPWSRRDLLKERQRILDFIRRVFPQWIHFVPASPGRWDPDKNTEELEFGRDVYGLCLATDIEGYTTVAAQHTPHEMWELLNAYYQVLGHPVISHDGMIADVTGDAMMSVWIDLPIETLRLSVCLAALEMEQEVERFNETSKRGRLPTRIGLFEGDMTLGVLNAGEGKNFRAIGNTVNTASRIQGVNKYLGTQILASAAIVANLTNIIYRPVGNFRLVGQEEPVELMEIVGTEADISAIQKSFYKQFANGLRLFQLGNWEDAINRFKYLLEKDNDDSVSSFYLKLAIEYQKHPPHDWHGIVTLEGK